MYFYDQKDPSFADSSEHPHSKNASNAAYQNAHLDPNDHTVEPQESPIDFLNNNQLEFDSNNLFNESSLFDASSTHWNHSSQHQPTLDTQQEAILLSDPNFLRQHQLLRDQHAYPEQPAPGGDPLASNLTAMLEEPSKQQQQQQAKKKQGNRRQHVVGKSNMDDGQDAPNEAKIDHQRRFNELQARFRVNYAPKASPSSKAADHDEQKPSHTSSTPTPSSTTQHPPPPTPPNAAAAANVAMIGGLVMNTNNNNRQDSFPSKEPLSSSVPARTMPIQIQRVARPNSNQPFDAESHQRQLDNQLTKVDFDDITVSELKEMLRQRGKPATGKKAILLQRLQEERDIAKGGRSPGSNRLANRHSQPLPFSSHSSAYHHAAAASASPSMPSFLPPGSPGGQLHRSIANMHIGSPPATTSRRYSPYSPRLSSSPKTTHHEYSSSVPLPANRYYNNPKTYKPFTSSALATPDREEDVNPFDSHLGSNNSAIQNFDSMDWSDPSALELLLQQGNV
ncbi:hypothetical protein FB192DRAFT_1273495 [Mucor lusitanicus]|uniref:SAP domain-containing protein n=1 Tax=Mucor circinelloides f. lusitanicus TaxID=29924 RepID=A0A8H4BRV3_MUCCL|nr:hypothetical protein FB192DRAFT_1273495 [Mucor lusitanicus]